MDGAGRPARNYPKYFRIPAAVVVKRFVLLPTFREPHWTLLLQTADGSEVPEDQLIDEFPNDSTRRLVATIGNRSRRSPAESLRNLGLDRLDQLGDRQTRKGCRPARLQDQRPVQT